jgi:hypothetical protein
VILGALQTSRLRRSGRNDGFDQGNDQGKVLYGYQVLRDFSLPDSGTEMQAQIINLLEDLQTQLGLTYLFVAHDLSVVQHICDRVLVMHQGRVVESGGIDDVFNNPQENYTKLLLSAIPSADPDVPLQPLGRESLGL